MEAQQCAREPTGTNGPTLNNNPTKTGNKNNEQKLRAATTIQTTINPHPPPHQQGGTVLNTKLVVVIAPGKRPASIPNLEAKPGSANGTATARLWESRTPPQHTYGSGQRLLSLWPLPCLRNALFADVSFRGSFIGRTVRPGPARCCAPDVQ